MRRSAAFAVGAALAAIAVAAVVLLRTGSRGGTGGDGRPVEATSETPGDAAGTAVPPEGAPVLRGARAKDGEGAQDGEPNTPPASDRTEPTPEEEKFVAWAIPALSDPLRSTRAYAVQGLAKIGPPAIRALTALIQALHDDDLPLRESIATALSALGTASVDARLAALSDEDARVRAGIAVSFAAMRWGEKPRAALAVRAVPALATCLSDAEDEVRIAAARALATFAAHARFAVPALVEALSNASSGTRVAAARTLGVLGLEAPAAVPTLARLAGDAKQPEEVRSTAAWALAHMGDSASAAVGDLVTAAKSDSVYVKSQALSAITTLGPAAASAMPTLAEIATRADEDNRSQALRAMARVGPTDSRTIAACRAALVADDDDVQAAGLDGLADAGDPGLAALLEAAKDDRVRERVDQAALHRKDDETVAGFLPRAAAVLANASPLLQRLALRGLEGLVAEWGFEEMDFKVYASVLPGVVRKTTGGEAATRSAAVSALGSIGRRSKESATTLAASLRDPDEGVRAAAATSLSFFETDDRDFVAKTILPALRQVENDPSEDVRISVAWAIRRHTVPDTSSQR
jgi:HEAT repeat protein